MKKIILTTVLLLVSYNLQAGESYVQGNFGFEASTFNFGLDYEMRKSQNYGYGAYFMFSSEEEDAFKPQLVSIGALAKIHLLDTQKLDVAVAPGFGISMYELSGQDETAIGPVMKFSMLYKMNAQMAVGVEMFKSYNWLNDEFGLSSDFLNLAFRYKL